MAAGHSNYKSNYGQQLVIRANKKARQVRIIGGKLRSRNIRFPSTTQLRPSMDVVRETLFNWLAPHIVQSRCLDLYAGSGIFGFEALSRGAKMVTLVDNDPIVIRSLEHNAKLLNVAHTTQIIGNDVERYLAENNHQYDIIFLDPPFSMANFQKIFGLIVKSNILNTHGLVYVEQQKSDSLLPLVPKWQMVRQKTRGMVQSTLIRDLDISCN